MKTFRIARDPYDDGKALYGRASVTFEPGLTVLVGCNGSGKSTLLKLLEDQLRTNRDILVLNYNDRVDGGTNRIDALMVRGNTTEAANMLCSSEGERIQLSVGYLISGMGSRIRKEHPNEVWVLLDAVGSGLSLDNAIEIKDFIAFIQEQESDIEFYFVVSTNEYEFASGSDCIDVTRLRHRTFKSYNVYRKCILETRKKKDRRYGDI